MDSRTENIDVDELYRDRSVSWVETEVQDATWVAIEGQTDEELVPAVMRISAISATEAL
jgi:uncharacterized protein YdeI (BOF family)